MLKKSLTLTISALALLCAAPASAQETVSAPAPELHRLDCGTIHVTTLNAFSDTYRYPDQEKTLTDSCYVIKHGVNILLWDTGLPDGLVGGGEGGSPPFVLTKKATLAQELEKLGLKPEDITHVGISHAHFDHTSNVATLPNAKLIIQQAEYDFMVNQPEAAKTYHMPPENFGDFLKPESEDKVTLVNGDMDIFGDGSVMALTLPGHTPGHMALLVKLASGKNFVLSGDQWHFHENHEGNGVPTFNYDRADTLASSDKLNKIIENTGATLVIQHEPADINKIPEGGLR